MNLSLSVLSHLIKETLNARKLAKMNLRSVA